MIVINQQLMNLMRPIEILKSSSNLLYLLKICSNKFPFDEKKNNLIENYCQFNIENNSNNKCNKILYSK